MAGDFNLVLDVNLDRNVTHYYNCGAADKLQEIMTEDELCDIWRLKNPDIKRFTWIKSRPVISWSRLDFFLISQNLSQRCQEVDIESCILSDHSMISLQLDTGQTPRGPGVWRFNDELLNDENFVKELKSTVTGVKRMCALEDINPAEIWEIIKEEVVEFCKKFAKESSYDDKLYQYNLKKLLCKLQERVTCEKLEEWEQKTICDNITTVNSELDSFATKDAKRAVFRYRCNYSKYGEVSSKYFFNIEKRNYVKKTMYVMRRSDGTLTKDYREILSAQHDFYSKLYTKDDTVKFQLENRTMFKLTPDQSLLTEQSISKAELFDALMTIKVNAAPGCDGLTTRLYKAIWGEISDPLYDLYVYAINTGKLSRSTRRGIINLIPKRNKDELEITGWRPITILCIDFKIFSKMVGTHW